MSELRLEFGDCISLQTSSLSGFFRIVLIRRDLSLAWIFPIGFGDTAQIEGEVQTEGEAHTKRVMLSAKSPIRCDLNWLSRLSELQCTKPKFEMEPWVGRPLELLTGKQAETYHAIKSRTEQLTASETLLKLLSAKSYSAELKKLAQQHGVHRTTLARDLARFFVCDCDVHKASVYAVLARRPSNTKERKVVRKLGRKSALVKSGHRPDSEGVNVSLEAKSSIEVFLKSITERSKLTKSAMYRRWKDQFASVPAGSLADGLIVWKSAPNLNITSGQFNYCVNKLESERKQTIEMVGRRRFSKDHRVLISHARNLIEHPGQCYVIDSTVADVYLVAATDRRLLLGRPTIYVVIDAFSSLILSIHIGLESPSLDQAQKALFRAVTEKDIHLDALGLSSKLLPALPQGCKPTSIFADRGELLSDGARKMSERASIALSLAAPYRAEWKSLVERYFGIQNEQVLHWIPGGVRERMRERGERDVRFDAKLTMNALNRMLLTLAAEWNLTKDMSKHISTAMLRSDVPTNPLGFWNYGIEELHGSAMFPSRKDAMQWMLQPLKAKLGRAGVVVLEDLRFTAPWMSEDDAYFAQIRDGKGYIYVDPDQPLEGLLYEKQSDDLRPVQLVDTRKYAELDVSLEDIRLTEHYIRLRRDEDTLGHDPIVATLRKMRSDEVHKETKLTTEANNPDTRTKSQRIANIKASRRHAIAIGDHLQKGTAEGSKAKGQAQTKKDSSTVKPVEKDIWTRVIDSTVGTGTSEDQGS